MRVGAPHKVEVRIARSEIERLAEGMGQNNIVRMHDIFVTRAMSIRLRAPEGGFVIESTSAETQWVEDTFGGLLMDDFASWRWTITPTRRGWTSLQLLISARTVGPDGLTAETALPDQEVDVRVQVNLRDLARRIAIWAAIAIAGGILGATVQAFWSMFIG